MMSRAPVNCISQDSFYWGGGVPHVSGEVVKLLHLTGFLITVHTLMHRPVLARGSRKNIAPMSQHNKNRTSVNKTKTQDSPLSLRGKRTKKLPDDMEKQSAVVFRNVGQHYFPQSRVECHYSLTSDHQWSNNDWIGIFELGSTSLKKYYTYTWALVPEGYTEGTSVNCCVLFHACYLPRPGAAEYQFVYVEKTGHVRARSRPFTFTAPKPLEELETLKEEQDEELLLVIPRAQLLQSRLEECLKKQTDLERGLQEAQQEADDEKKESRRLKAEWEKERDAMKEEVTELRVNLRHTCDMLDKMEGKHQDARCSQESLTSQRSKLMADKTEREQRVKDLEDEVKALTERKEEGSVEVERLRERLKKVSGQMKHNEDMRKSLQADVLAGLTEVRGLQERLEASEHANDCLRRELRELSTHQAHTHTELHQVRLQVAQLTLQLSEDNLVLREERASWALEREANRQGAEAANKKIQEVSCEVQRKEDWLQEERVEREKLEVELRRERDQSRVLLGEANQELQELKAALRKVQTEREEQQLKTQDMMMWEGPPAEDRKQRRPVELIQPDASEPTDSPMW